MKPKSTRPRKAAGSKPGMGERLRRALARVLWAEMLTPPRGTTGHRPR